MVLTKARKGQVRSRCLTFFGLSLTQPSDDWKDALLFEEQEEQKVAPIHLVNIRKRALFLRNEELQRKMILQVKEDHRREWLGREMIRRRCIHPVQHDFNRLFHDNKVKVRKLIMMMATRRVFPLITEKTPSYSTVLTGSKTVWFQFPWEATVLIVQCYITSLLEVQVMEFRGGRGMPCPSLVQYREDRRKWFQTSGHICRCPWDGDYGYRTRDCDCYEMYLENCYWQEMYSQMAIVRALDEDWDYQVDFPDGEVGEESRSMFREGLKRKPQKRKSRYSPQKKFHARGGRTGKRCFLRRHNED